MTNRSSNQSLCDPKRWLAGFVLALVLFVSAACASGPAVVLHSTSGQEVRVAVEVANTPGARSQGLMYRKELGANAGMLFVFPKEEVVDFWMKNTLIPLDMIFLDRGRKVVGVVENAKPLSTQGRGVGKASTYVLEVNGGFAAKHGIAAGTTAEFVDVPAGAK